jgi:hypothetical protein
MTANATVDKIALLRAAQCDVSGPSRDSAESREGVAAANPFCAHRPACPPADAVDREAARVVAAVPEQGWSLLCNGVVAFHDGGEILPDNTVTAAHRGPARHLALTAVDGGRS